MSVSKQSICSFVDFYRAIIEMHFTSDDDDDSSRFESQSPLLNPISQRDF